MTMAADPGKSKKAGHRQRLRDKFLHHGLEKFTDEEIVAQIDGLLGALA